MNKLSIIAASALLGLTAVGAQAATAPSIYPGKLIGAGPEGLPGGEQMATADFNGDGRADIAVADMEAGAWIFLSAKDGGYAAPQFYPTLDYPWAIAAGDLNGDSHLDIVVGNGTPGALSVLLNNGDGTFQAHVDYTYDGGVSDSTNSIVVGDADGDGIADVVVGGSSTSVYVVPGNGNGTLSEAGIQVLSTDFPYHYGVSIADMNSDGLPDIVAGSGCDGGPDAAVDVYLGKVGGTFAASPDESIAAAACPESVPVADVNEDGVPDVIVAGYDDSVAKVFFGDGAGGLIAGPSYDLPAGSEPYWVHVADIDGDRHIDILVPESSYDIASVLYGKGDGSFEKPISVAMGMGAYDVAAVDANGDGILDLVGLDEYGAPGIVIARGLGERRFRSYRSYSYQNASGDGQSASSMVSTDFNGDGAPDVATVNTSDNTLSILLNDGQGGFDPVKVLPLTGSAPQVVALATADFNGDGNADLITADGGGTLWVGMGNGDGTFNLAPGGTLAFAVAVGIAVGDVDIDGELDVVVSEVSSNQIQVCRGGGHNTFDCGLYAPVPVGSPTRLALADINDDGKLDLAVSNNASDAFVFLGDGKGGFGDGAGTAAPVATLAGAGGGYLAVGDINGDSVQDLVVGSNDTDISVFKGKGDGTFDDAATYASGVYDGSAPLDVALADTNADGNSDIVAANFRENTISVLLSNGDGTFASPVNLAANFQSGPILALDMDADGLVDIIDASVNTGAPLYTTVGVYLHNHVPTVTAKNLTVEENASGSGTLAAVDSDRDNIGFAVVTPPAHGKLELDADTGAYTYTPAADFTGSDTFTATAGDGVNTSVPVAVDITVKPASTGDGNTGDGDTGGSNNDGSGPVNANNPPASSSGGGGALGFLAFGLLGLPLLRKRRHI